MRPHLGPRGRCHAPSFASALLLCLEAVAGIPAAAEPPVAASPEAPRALLPDDLVVAVEPRLLEVWARRIDGEEVGP